MSDAWKTALLNRLREPVAVVGIGNVMSGDDGAGPEVIRRLRGRTRATLFDCGTVPENFIGPITRAAPAFIILVDAVPVGTSPGTVALFALEHLHETTFHTHASTPALFLDLVVSRTGAECCMLGVQPESVGFGVAMSPAVTRAAACVADAIAELLPASKETP